MQAGRQAGRKFRNDDTGGAFDKENPRPMYRDHGRPSLLLQDKVRTTIMGLASNKASGADRLPAEGFKAGSEELVGSIYRRF